MIAILQATSVNGVLAIAITLVIITGGIDLSVGTMMTFCAVITDVVLTYAGMPLILGVVAAVLSVHHVYVFEIFRCENGYSTFHCDPWYNADPVGGEPCYHWKSANLF
jgi:ABC-type xylose transport system permease subunit